MSRRVCLDYSDLCGCCISLLHVGPWSLTRHRGIMNYTDPLWLSNCVCLCMCVSTDLCVSVSNHVCVAHKICLYVCQSLSSYREPICLLHMLYPFPTLLWGPLGHFQSHTQHVSDNSMSRTTQYLAVETWPLLTTCLFLCFSFFQSGIYGWREVCLIREKLVFQNCSILFQVLTHFLPLFLPISLGIC